MFTPKLGLSIVFHIFLMRKDTLARESTLPKNVWASISAEAFFQALNLWIKFLPLREARVLKEFGSHNMKSQKLFPFENSVAENVQCFLFALELQDTKYKNVKIVAYHLGHAEQYWPAITIHIVIPALTPVLLNQDSSCLANSFDPDQMASDEINTVNHLVFEIVAKPASGNQIV